MAIGGIELWKYSQIICIFQFYFTAQIKLSLIRLIIATFNILTR